MILTMPINLIFLFFPNKMKRDKPNMTPIPKAPLDIPIIKLIKNRRLNIPSMMVWDFFCNVSFFILSVLKNQPRAAPKIMTK